MKIFKNLYISFASFLFIFLGAAGVSLVANSPTAYAETPQQAACNAINGGSCDSTKGNLTPLITTIIKILSVVAGFIAIIMIIVAGLKYVTSGGDANKVASAKNALIFAIIGLIIVVLSQFMVRFVLSQSKKIEKPAETSESRDSQNN